MIQLNWRNLITKTKADEEKKRIIAAIVPRNTSVENQEDKEILDAIHAAFLAKTKNSEESLEIRLAEGEYAVLFKRSSVLAQHKGGQINFLTWLSSFSPIDQIYRLAIIDTNPFVSNYSFILEMLEQKLRLEFQVRAKILPESITDITDNYLRSRSIFYKDNLLETFEIHLTGLNLASLLENYDLEDLLQDESLQERIKKRINAKQDLLTEQGIALEVLNIKWKKDVSKPIPRYNTKRFTRKIEAGRRSQPIEEWQSSNISTSPSSSINSLKEPEILESKRRPSPIDPPSLPLEKSKEPDILSKPRRHLKDI